MKNDNPLGKGGFSQAVAKPSMRSSGDKFIAGKATCSCCGVAAGQCSSGGREKGVEKGSYFPTPPGRPAVGFNGSDTARSETWR